MCKKRSLLALVGAVLVAGSVQSAKATSLAALLAGASLSVDDKIWDNWRNFSITGSQAGSFDPVLVEVTANGSIPNNPFLLYQSSQFFAGPGQDLDVRFDYDIHTASGAPTIEDNAFDLLTFGTTQDGRISFAETKRNAAGDVVAALLVTNTSPHAHASFDPVSFLTVTKDLAVVGNHGEAFVSDFTQHYSQASQTPEPGTFATFISMGVGGSLLFLRRRVRK